MKTETALNNLNDTEREMSGQQLPITYGVVKEIYYLNRRRSKKTYGIVGFSNLEEDGMATIVLSLNDITTDYKAISDLVDSFNRNNLSPMHIYEMVEEFIS